MLRDFDLAEEALNDAFVAAAEQWRRDGVPKNPRAWLVSAGRFKAIDRLRRRARFDALATELAMQIEADAEGDLDMDDDAIPDDRLRLIFTCCHPALPPDAQVALTLREVCGLTTEEIARAFLVSTPTIAQRIVRAKARIRDERLPYVVPASEELSDRLDAVLRVVYLVFNEGYSASSGDAVTRADLSGEAIRLCRLLVALLPDPEAIGLLALMLLHESRRMARATPEGDLILLPDQDRALWDRDLIAEGSRARRAASATRRIGPYGLQAAIAAVHASVAERRGNRLGRSRPALRRPGPHRAVAGRGPQPRRRRVIPDRTGGRAGADGGDCRRREICPTTTSSIPPGPTCSASSDESTKPRRPTGGRSSWSGRSPSAAFSREDWRKSGVCRPV